jgi:hypothetical protein
MRLRDMMIRDMLIRGMENRRLRAGGCITFSRTKEKGERRSPFSRSGGADGTRTRDPRRDRPVF